MDIKDMKRGNKNAISPVVATVLLIMMVVVIALIIFLWFKNISGEVITKEGTQNIKLSCDKVKLEASCSADTLFIKNTGTISISGMKVKSTSPSGSSTETLDGFEGLTGGSAGSYPYSCSGDLVLIPVLLGNANEGQRNYVCQDSGQAVI